MKTKQLSKIFIALIFSTSVLNAQNTNNPILINAPKFAQPLIEKWISEYSKIKPEVNIQVVQKNSKSIAAPLNLVVEPATASLPETNQKFIHAGRFALVPVSNSKNPLLNEIGRKGLNKKGIDKLFFDSFDLDEEQDSKEKKLAATVYSAENQNKQSVALAQHFGHLSSELRGKKVVGDEIYLLTALKKDSTGISYNNLNYLFDTSSRKIKSDIAFIPLDLKKEFRILQTGNIDDALAILEKNQIETIPVGKLGFVYSQQNIPDGITDFLKWVLTDGQKYNHDLGFLNLEEQDAFTAQSAVQNERLLTIN